MTHRPLSIACSSAILLAGAIATPLSAQKGAVAASAAGITELRLVTKRANVTIVVIDADSVTAVAAPERGLTKRGCNADDESSFSASARAAGSSLSIESTPVSEYCLVRWEVRLPSRLALNLRMKSGHARVSGVSAGLSFAADAASLDADLPHGPVYAKTGVGDLTVHVAVDDVGDLRLRSDVGTVGLHLGDRVLSHAKAPGSGDRLSLRGTGDDVVTLQTAVGKVEAHLGAASRQKAP